jgi:hypothetical protein
MTVRTTLAGLAGAAALLASVLAPVASTAAPAPSDERAAVPRTKLTFTVADCEGCEIRLYNALQKAGQHPAEVRVWQSRSRTVTDGRVTFHLASRRTWGLSATVVASWEGQTGYLATVAWRYNGEHVGDVVTLDEAVTKTRASACWEGTRRPRLRIPLVVEEVEVDGVHGRVPGTIAFVPTTQSWLKPMREVWDGVLGSQDVNFCR